MNILYALLIVAVAAHLDQFDSNVRVTYGSVIKLINPQSHFMVHSHDVFFGRGGVLSVTGYPIDDLGSYWQVNQPFQTTRKTYQDSVRCGDTVTISSAIVGYSLRVEETQFGLTTQLLPMVHGITRDKLDEKINWQIQCSQKSEGSEVHFNDAIRLKHQVTGKYVSLDQAYAYTEANCGRGCSIAGQIELHAMDTHDDSTTIFQIKSGLAFDSEFVASQEE